MNPLNYMRLHDYSSRNSRQHWINASNGKISQLENVGGEFHTWTEVTEFGGGIFSILNFGEPIRPECGVLPSGASVGTLAAPGPKNIYLEFGDTEDGPTAGSANLPVG